MIVEISIRAIIDNKGIHYAADDTSTSHGELRPILEAVAHHMKKEAGISDWSELGSLVLEIEFSGKVKQLAS